MTAPLRFIATVPGGQRVVVEMVRGQYLFFVWIDGEKTRSLYDDEGAVRDLVRRRYRGLVDWQPEVGR